jgi:hypothetical protein
MPNPKDYPKWFSIYSKPYAPSKPRAPEVMVEKTTPIIEQEYRECDTISMSDFEGCDKVVVGYISESGSYFRLEGYSTKPAPNPNYDKEYKAYIKYLEKYKSDYKKYKTQLKEWKQLARKWRKEEKAENTAAELKQLVELAKKHAKTLICKCGDHYPPTGDALGWDITQYGSVLCPTCQLTLQL